MSSLTEFLPFEAGDLHYQTPTEAASAGSDSVQVAAAAAAEYDTQQHDERYEQARALLQAVRANPGYITRGQRASGGSGSNIVAAAAASIGPRAKAQVTSPPPPAAAAAATNTGANNVGVTKRNMTLMSSSSSSSSPTTAALPKPIAFSMTDSFPPVLSMPFVPAQSTNVAQQQPSPQPPPPASFTIDIEQPPASHHHHHHHHSHQPASAQKNSNNNNSNAAMAEHFANNFTEKLHGIGERKKRWITWVAVIALTMTVSLALFVALLHNSHKDLSGIVQTHSKSLDSLEKRLTNSSSSVLLLSAPITGPAPLPLDSSGPDPGGGAKRQRLLDNENANAKRYPHEDEADQSIALEGRERQRWLVKSFSKHGNGSTQIEVPEWHDVPYDRVLSFTVCCRVGSLGSANESMVCAPRSRLSRFGEKGTRLHLVIEDGEDDDDKDNNSSDSQQRMCNFRCLVTE